MSNWKILEINCTTGEQIERDPTEAEIAQKASDESAWLAEQAAIEAAEQTKAEAKASAENKLTALGLTAEEIAALRG